MKTITEDELRESLRPFRPDPEEFRRGIGEKLAERDPGRDSERGPEIRAQSQDLPRRWSVAASLLPFGVLRPIGETAAPPALAAGKKALGAALVLPALSVAMLAATFAAAVRTAARLPAGTASREAADRAVLAWWKEHLPHAVLTLAGLTVLGAAAPVEAVLAVLLISMVGIAAASTSLARVGAATRAGVGRLTSGFLATLLVLAMVFDDLAAGRRAAEIPEHWIPIAVLLGWVACSLAGRWERSWSPVRKSASVLLPSAALALSIGFVDGSLRPVDEVRMTRFVQGFDRPLTDAAGWVHLGHVGRWLRANGHEDLDASGPRRIVEEAWSAGDGELFDSTLPREPLTAGARLGALPEDLWQAIRTDGETGELLLEDGEIRVPQAAELCLRALARGSLAEDQRDHLARRLHAGWPQPDAFVSLEAMAAIVDLLDLVGRPPSLEPLRPDVHRALELRWRGGATSLPAAGFVSDPAMVGVETVSSVLLLDATHAAVALMRRFGPAPGVDLNRVRLFLEELATPSLIEAAAPGSFARLAIQDYRYRASVALRELMAMTEARAAAEDRRSLGSLLVSERILVGAALLVSLCLFATIRAGASGAVNG